MGLPSLLKRERTANEWRWSGRVHIRCALVPRVCMSDCGLGARRGTCDAWPAMVHNSGTGGGTGGRLAHSGRIVGQEGRAHEEKHGTGRNLAVRRAVPCVWPCGAAAGWHFSRRPRQCATTQCTTAGQRPHAPIIKQGQPTASAGAHAHPSMTTNCCVLGRRTGQHGAVLRFCPEPCCAV